MKRVLHILTKENDSLAAEMIRRQREPAGLDMVVVDLTRGPIDYLAVLQKVFAADSVEVW